MKLKLILLIVFLFAIVSKSEIVKVSYLKYTSSNLAGFDYFMLDASDFEHDQHWYCYHKDKLKLIHDQWKCDFYEGICGEIKIVATDSRLNNVFLLSHAVSGEIALDLAKAVEKKIFLNNHMCIAGDQGILSRDGELLVNFYRLKSWDGYVDYMYFS